MSPYLYVIFPEEIEILNYIDHSVSLFIETRETVSDMTLSPGQAIQFYKDQITPTAIYKADGEAIFQNENFLKEIHAWSSLAKSISTHFLSIEKGSKFLAKPELLRLKKEGKDLLCHYSSILLDNESYTLLQLIDCSSQLSQDHESFDHRLRDALESSSIIAEVDEIGAITYANDQFYELTGYDPKNDKELSILNLRSESMTHSTYKDLWSTLESGNTWIGELESRKKGGEIFWTESIIIPQSNEEGERTYFAISNNISERKEGEKEIKKLNKKLELEIEKRTEDIKTAVDELEAFSYSVSHDLRAPLRAITGFSGLLKEEFSDEMSDEAKRYLGIIQEGTLQMAHLIDDLLQFSRVGRIELKKDYFDPNIMVHEIVKKARTDIPDEVEIKIQPMPQIYGDSNTVKLVFNNLIINAIKFSRPIEKAQIIIGSKKQDNELAYFVQDNGVGFDMRYADKLFKVFQRLHSAQEFEGTGVGLAIVSRIVHKHGGRVWGESLPGSNTSFYFTLPKENDNGSK